MSTIILSCELPIAATLLLMCVSEAFVGSPTTDSEALRGGAADFHKKPGISIASAGTEQTDSKN
ncbi:MULTISPECIES: hypothetical protein [unclassified Microcoleus]|uniref:hypothetical protein n=1 Tax=unclassified Microcoleus TaxID=2642155 RepID=UPI002FD367BD